MYRIPAADEPVSQGDIFDSCPVFALDPDADSIDSEPLGWRARVVVLTQSCDLAAGKTRRAVVALAHTAQELVDGGVLKAKTVRDQVRRHQLFGWYFLPGDDLVAM